MEKRKRQIPVNQLVIGTYYRYDKDNKIIYDIEEIRREFEEQIEKQLNIKL